METVPDAESEPDDEPLDMLADEFRIACGKYLKALGKNSLRAPHIHIVYDNEMTDVRDIAKPGQW